MEVEEFNNLPAETASEKMLAVCHSAHWAKEIVSARPYKDLSDLKIRAQTAWLGVSEADILEAFSGHPKIGDLNVLKDKFSIASAEQGQVTSADESVLQDLVDMNQAYEEKNGFIFIVCASGKPAEDMRDMLKKRLQNDRAKELVNGAMEQAKITELRLDKLFGA